MGRLMFACDDCDYTTCVEREYVSHECCSHRPGCNCQVKASTQGTKHDEGKNPIGLIPPEAVIEESKVWGFGAKKYGRNNFRKGLTYMRVLHALLRHTYALLSGEDTDPESGLHHAAHIRCCAGMLLVFRNEKSLDDRFEGIPTKKEEGNGSE